MIERNFASLAFAVLLFISGGANSQEVVVQDGDVTLTDSELSYYVSLWTKQMREVAIADEGDRLELLNLVLANKKVANQADQFVVDFPEYYLEYQDGLEAYKREFVLRKTRDNLDLPDFTDLARERFDVSPDKYALVPERRISSHILFASPPGKPRGDVLTKAQGVLDELRDGADFVEMVKLHSEDPGTAAKDGKFDRWMVFGEQGVTPPYSEGLFTIEAIGEYAELVQSQFGVHIIRLDGVQEKSYKSFEEVKPAIVAELSAEYVRLAMKDYITQFQMGSDVVVDEEAVLDILESVQASK